MGRDAHDRPPSSSSGTELGIVPEPSPRSRTVGLVLRCETGRLIGSQLSVTRETTLIGRHDGVEGIRVDLDLTELEAGEARTSISRRHAEILRTPEGWCVVDLNSANGTQVDGARLRPGQPQALMPGCRLTLGRLEFRVHEA